jgi:hypothetical protein
MSEAFAFILVVAIGVFFACAILFDKNDDQSPDGMC